MVTIKPSFSSAVLSALERMAKVLLISPGAKVTAPAAKAPPTKSLAEAPRKPVAAVSAQLMVCESAVSCVRLMVKVCPASTPSTTDASAVMV